MTSRVIFPNYTSSEVARSDRRLYKPDRPWPQHTGLRIKFDPEGDVEVVYDHNDRPCDLAAPITSVEVKRRLKARRLTPRPTDVPVDDPPG